MLAEITAPPIKVTPLHTLHQGVTIRAPPGASNHCRIIVVHFYRSLLWDFYFFGRVFSFFPLLLDLCSWVTELEGAEGALITEGSHWAPRAAFVSLKPPHRNHCSVTGAAWLSLGLETSKLQQQVGEKTNTEALCVLQAAFLNLQNVLELSLKAAS